MKPTMSALILLALAVSTTAAAGEDVFLDSIIDFDDTSVRLPVYEGVRDGETIYYIVTEASDGDAADDYGVPDVSKLENAAGTGAVQQVTVDDDGRIVFPASVDFSPARVVVGDPVTGFPPLQAEPGAVGEDGYSPLIQLPDGTILNAPHIANDSGDHDSLLGLDVDAGYADIEMVDGFANDKPVLYLSTEASAPGPAALEGATYTPALNLAPGLGNDGSDSSRAQLAAFTNGPTGVDNPERQGLNSALLGEGGPRNLLAWLPNQGRYSPLWDVHLSTFAAGVTPELVTDTDDVEDLADDGDVTAPDGGNWGATGFIVNCPVMVRVD
ncbi:MAG: hypothetical protein KTR31_04525 [Myxococcales bacterium]|nr:hypothetical protein [Myxococcales bacterium]